MRNFLIHQLKLLVRRGLRRLYWLIVWLETWQYTFAIMEVVSEALATEQPAKLEKLPIEFRGMAFSLVWEMRNPLNRVSSIPLAYEIHREIAPKAQELVNQDKFMGDIAKKLFGDQEAA